MFELLASTLWEELTGLDVITLICVAHWGNKKLYFEGRVYGARAKCQVLVCDLSEAGVFDHRFKFLLKQFSLVYITLHYGISD